MKISSDLNAEIKHKLQLRKLSFMSLFLCVSTSAITSDIYVYENCNYGIRLKSSSSPKWKKRQCAMCGDNVTNNFQFTNVIKIG